MTSFKTTQLQSNQWIVT